MQKVINKLILNKNIRFRIFQNICCKPINQENDIAVDQSYFGNLDFGFKISVMKCLQI